MFRLFRRKPPQACPKCGTAWRAEYRDLSGYEAEMLDNNVFSARNINPAANCSYTFHRSRTARKSNSVICRCEKCGFSRSY